MSNEAYMPSPVITTSSVGQNSIVTTGTSTSTEYTLKLTSRSAKSQSAEMNLKQLESAVYSYIRALRALGNTTIGVDQIAKALNLSIPQVNSTLAALKSKGVKGV
jgi:predicted Rossmann fold nucleotide-binding protein DprA/Smf involved in DNA uptake